MDLHPTVKIATTVKMPEMKVSRLIDATREGGEDSGAACTLKHRHRPTPSPRPSRAPTRHNMSTTPTVPAVLPNPNPNRISTRPTMPVPSVAITSHVRPVPTVRRSTLPAALHNDELDRALASMRVELEAVFDATQLRVIGHEVRVVGAFDRSVAEKSIRHSKCRDDAAKSDDGDGNGKGHGHGLLNNNNRDDVRLRRHVRSLAAIAFTNQIGAGESGSRGLLLLDVYPLDLLDPELYRQDTALSRIADKVILQLRGPVDSTVEDLAARISVLRFQGYRFALADIESTPSRLSLLAELSPEYVKIDASLSRGMSSSLAKRRVVEGLTTMCTLLGATPIAEGVATVEDRTALAEAGCMLVQGPIHSDERATIVVSGVTRIGARSAAASGPRSGASSKSLSEMLARANASGTTQKSATRETFLKRAGNQR